MKSGRKVVIIGLDGATSDIIYPMVERGELPHIAHLLQSGSSGVLASTHPPLTPPAWVTFSTGKNPGKHGVYDFLSMPYSTDATMAFTNFNSIRCATFWEILRDSGLRFGIVNLPMTYPPSPLNGFLISGMDTPNDRVNFSYPANLITELRDRSIHYKARFFLDGQESSRDLKERLESFFQIEEQHKDAFLYLLSNKPWDVFVGVFMLLDKVQHFYWHFHRDSGNALDSESDGLHDAIYKAYRLIDRFIGEIVSVVDPKAHVILVSDHGFGKMDSIFFTNEWLRREGFLKLKRIKPLSLIELMKLDSIERTGTQILGRLGLGSVAKILPDSLLRKRLRLRVPRLRYSAAEVDWSKTKAYGASYGIYVNLKGRTSHGIVDPGAEYEAIRESITQRLQELSDPATGEKVIGELLKKEEVYSGPYLQAAPDLVFDFKSLKTVPHHTYSFSRVLGRRKNFGTHQFEGFFSLRGPGVKRNHRIEGSRIVDVAPTLFYLLGQPIPDDFDGQVITNAFEDTCLQTHPKQFQPPPDVVLRRGDEGTTYTPEEASEIAAKLRGLGYLG